MVMNFKKVGLSILITGIIVLAIFLLLHNRVENQMPSSNPEIPYKEADSTDMRTDSMILGADDFFAEYRVERELMRSRQIEMLQEVVNNPALKEAQPEAATKLVKIAGDIEKELQTEGMIKAQGFSDCVVITRPGTVLVVIQTGKNLPPQEEAIMALIEKTTGNGAEEICMIYRDKQY